MREQLSKDSGKEMVAGRMGKETSTWGKNNLAMIVLPPLPLCPDLDTHAAWNSDVHTDGRKS